MAVGVDVPGVAEAGLVPAVHDQISSLSQFYSFGSLQSRISVLNSVLGPPRQLDKDDKVPPEATHEERLRALELPHVS